MISFLDYFRQGYRYRQLIMTMAKRELVRKYIGSSVGLMWAVVHPLFMISILWVVFGLGFKAAPAQGVPFVVYLTAGLSCWYLFSDIVSGSTGVVMEHAELIKKMPFPSQILPFIKTIVGIVNHAIFIIILIGLIAFQPPFSEMLSILSLLFSRLACGTRRFCGIWACCPKNFMFILYTTRCSISFRATGIHLSISNRFGAIRSRRSFSGGLPLLFWP
jgi:ABC-type polysaccharide/polyol phosphate export permease